VSTTETPLHAGLSSAEAARLLEQHGPNQLAAAETVPAWKKFLAQFKDMLILILIAAALVSLGVSGELKTPLVVLASFKRIARRSHSMRCARC
jgi:magnesium-transporting ATPase (P-type)